MQNAKKELRRKLRETMRMLPAEYCNRTDAAIAKALFASPQWQIAKTIFCYVSTGAEINTLPILEKALQEGKRLCAPVCMANGIMEAREIKELGCLQSGILGILEPDKSLSALVLPEQIDLVLVPCVGCTRTGIRLGQGGGYYDRYLPAVKEETIGLCREVQLLEKIPAEPWDMPLKRVLSEKMMYNNNLKT